MVLLCSLVVVGLDTGHFKNKRKRLLVKNKNSPPVKDCQKVPKEVS
jgi:hypothetical protein